MLFLKSHWLPHAKRLKPRRKGHPLPEATSFNGPQRPSSSICLHLDELEAVPKDDPRGMRMEACFLWFSSPSDVAPDSSCR
mmetsp:Transcript_20425/g.62239  ORF Transcript_20425/g.62239 Transcript_20425/m.62239 type:complete len:81 (+) Transcript_20425:219-461(+)